MKIKNKSIYQAWQELDHAKNFDHQSAFGNSSLRKHYESHNEIVLLNEYLKDKNNMKLLEIGCATGEFFRYVKTYLPNLQYNGVDVSIDTIAKAIKKYGDNLFSSVSPDLNEIKEKYNIVMHRDVVLHQEDPYGFLEKSLKLSKELLIFRCRTRDVGNSILDINDSCQFHYGGYWMPYFVLNTDELVKFLSNKNNISKIIISRDYHILGGIKKRFLPKDLYLPETKSAFTGVAVYINQKESTDKTEVIYQDREEKNNFNLLDKLMSKIIRRTKQLNLKNSF